MTGGGLHPAGALRRAKRRPERRRVFIRLSDGLRLFGRPPRLRMSSTQVNAATAVGKPTVVTASATTCSISPRVAPASGAGPPPLPPVPAAPPQHPQRRRPLVVWRGSHGEGTLPVRSPVDGGRN